MAHMGLFDRFEGLTAVVANDFPFIHCLETTSEHAEVAEQGAVNATHVRGKEGNGLLI